MVFIANLDVPVLLHVLLSSTACNVYYISVVTWFCWTCMMPSSGVLFMLFMHLTFFNGEQRVPCATNPFLTLPPLLFAFFSYLCSLHFSLFYFFLPCCLLGGQWTLHTSLTKTWLGLYLSTLSLRPPFVPHLYFCAWLQPIQTNNVNLYASSESSMVIPKTTVKKSRGATKKYQLSFPLLFDSVDRSTHSVL